MKKILKEIKNQKGMTLVELIVTFALLGILMTAAIATLSPAMSVFQKVNAMSRGQSVSSILFDKIGSELETATGSVRIADGKEDTNGIKNAGEEGTCIAYLDKDGQEVVMYAGANPAGTETNTDTTLQIHYNKTPSLAQGIDWYFSKATYMNEKIQTLKFKRVVDGSGAPTNRIQITLKLENTRTGTTYERGKVVECFKLDNSPTSFTTDGNMPGLLY